MICPDCAPYPADPRHWAERLSDLLEWGVERLATPVVWIRRRLPRWAWSAFGRAVGWAFDGGRRLGWIQTRPVTGNDPVLTGNARLVAAAAKQRGIRIESLEVGGRFTNLFEATTNTGRRWYYEGLPTVTLDTPKLVYDDKSTLKQTLRRLSLPVADGRSFTSKRLARRYATELDWPLVVKPAAGSLSRHTYAGLADAAALDRALDGVKRFAWEFLVERHVDGAVWRVTFVGGQLVAACRRDPASVTGNGRDTIATLVAAKEQERSGRVGRRVSFVSPETGGLLRDAGLRMDSVLPPNTRLPLQRKVIAALGADFHDVTETVHPTTLHQLDRLVSHCQAPILGIDLIAHDLGQPLEEQGGVILEVNSLPVLELHHQPASGLPRDVAGAILDHALAEQ